MTMRDNFECLKNQPMSPHNSEVLQYSPKVKILPIGCQSNSINEKNKACKSISKSNDFLVDNKNSNELIVSTSTSILSISPSIYKNQVLDSPSLSLDLSPSSSLSYSTNCSSETANMTENPKTPKPASQVEFDYYNEFYFNHDSMDNEIFLVYNETTNSFLKTLFSNNSCLNFLLNPIANHLGNQEKNNSLPKEFEKVYFKFTIDYFKPIIESFTLTNAQLNIKPRLFNQMKEGSKKLFESLKNLSNNPRETLLLFNSNLKQINDLEIDWGRKNNLQTENLSSLDSTFMLLLINSENNLNKMSLESIKKSQICSNYSSSGKTYEQNVENSSFPNNCNSNCNNNLTEFHNEFEFSKSKLAFLLAKKLEYLNEMEERNLKDIELNNKLGTKVIFKIYIIY